MVAVLRKLTPLRKLTTGGVYFNGINAYGEILNSSGLNINGEFTIFCRVRLSWLEKSAGLRDILVKAPGAGWPTANFRLAFDKVSPYRGITFVHGDGSNYEVFHTWNFQADFNREYSVAVTPNGIYINGELVEEIDITLGWYQNSNNIRVGLNPSNSYANCFPGCVRDVIMYNKTLSDSEILNMHNNSHNPQRDGLMLWLPFSENQGVVARDYSGNGNDCQLYNCRWVLRKPFRVEVV